MNSKARYVRVEDIPIGSQFKAPNQPTKRTKEEVKEANTWWKSLSDSLKCVIYENYLEIAEDIKDWKEE